VAGVSYDPVEILKRFSDRNDIGFTLLSDAGTKIIPAFGLLNERFAPGSRWYGLAHPITLVVDNAGIVRHRFSERSYRERPEVDLVLDILRKDGGE
jgi:peroxiredoxin